jgi:hypothetical protein
MLAPLLQKLRFSPSFICRHFVWFLLVSLTFTHPLSAQVQNFNKEDYFSKGTVTAGNKFYRVAIENILGEGVGLYTVRTGPRHPITQRLGRPQDLLGGGARGQIDPTDPNTPIGQPGTSYTTIRSYTSGTDYVQTEFARRDDNSRFKPVWLDSTFINDFDIVAEDKYLTPITKAFFFEEGTSDTLTTGYIVTYELPNPNLANARLLPDQMIITQKIDVHGADFGDSWVEITTIVKNTGPQAIEIGIRYLWDLAIGNDDGPRVTESTFNTSFGNNEAGFDWINFAFFRAEANDAVRTTVPPAYNVYGAALTPVNLLRVPLQPTRLQQVSWPLAFSKAFDYAIDNTLDITTTKDPNAGVIGGDKAMQFFWGEKLDNALTIKSGDFVQVTQALFASLPEERPTLYDLALPSCEVTKRQFEPVKRFEIAIQDEISGLRRVQAENLFNAKIEVADFKTGATEPVSIVVTAIDKAQPVRIMVRAVDLSGNFLECSPTFETMKSDAGLASNLAPLPGQFALSQNLPNPFQGATTIQIDVPAPENFEGSGRVALNIYNLFGQVVRRLVDERLPAGTHRIKWNGRDEAGREVAAGVYLYELIAGKTRMTKKMALMR